jgi:hypothetical protein
MTIDSRVRVFPFFNSLGVAIPPFACMVVTGATDNNREMVYAVRQPNYTDEQLQNPSQIVFNDGRYVPSNSYGMCSSDMPAIALVDPSGSPVIGGTVGPVANSWALGTNGIAFVLKCREQSNPHTEGTATPWMVEPYVGETEIVRVTSNVTDADGYYTGEVQRFDTLTKTWYTVRNCRVRDANQ